MIKLRSTFSFYWIIALFLLAGCTKQDNPPQVTKGVSSFRLNSHKLSTGETTSRLVTGEAHSLTSTDSGYDYLEIILTTTPQPASGSETLKLYFSKTSGQPNSAYMLDDIVLYGHPVISASSMSTPVATLAAINNGGLSGSFSGNTSVAKGFVMQVDYTLTGSFENARP